MHLENIELILYKGGLPQVALVGPSIGAYTGFWNIGALLD